MDLLRRLSFLIASLGAFAAMTAPQDKTVVEAAVGSLKNCDFSISRRLSGALETYRPDLAALYRLAWIQTLSKLKPGSEASSPFEADESENTLAWKSSSEIWNDEWKSLQGRNRCSALQTADSPFSPSKEEGELVRRILESWRDQNSNALENSLVTLSFNDWITEENVASEPLSEQPVSCQRRAESLLKGKDLSSEQMKAWHSKCASCTGRFCAAIKLQLADKMAEKGDWKASFPLYVDVSRELGEIPSTLSYRLTALGVLSQQPTEQLLKSITPLLLETDEAVVPKLQKEKLQSSVCERLSQESVASLGRAFDRTYAKRDRARQIRSWMLMCEPSEARHIVRIVDAKHLQLSQEERDLIRSTWKLREAQEKVRKKNPSRESEISVGGVASRSKKLGGTLSIPVLLPFPAMTFPSSAYDFRAEFLSAAAKSLEKK